MDFGLGFKIKKHPNWGCFINLNEVLDVDPLFKFREKSNDRDFCVYFIYDGSGKLVYIGEGIYYILTVYVWEQFLKSRPFVHKQNKKGTELVAKYLGSNYTISIVASGLTKLEARLLEALFIRNELNKGRKLTAQGAKEWDRYSLMNKNRGMCDKTFKDNAEVFLNKIEWKSLKTFY